MIVIFESINVESQLVTQRIKQFPWLILCEFLKKVTPLPHLPYNTSYMQIIVPRSLFHVFDFKTQEPGEK
jgi:hypothetical protein